MRLTISYKKGFIHISHYNDIYSDGTTIARKTIKAQVNGYAYLIETKSILSAKRIITKHLKYSK